MKPLGIDLFCGLGGWTEGFLSEGYEVIGFDIENHVYGEHRYPAQLVLQDVRTLHGRQFKDAAIIVASSPCQKYSYMAMPWTLAKEKVRWYSDPMHPERLVELNELFEQPRRIQREACEAAGRFIPMIQENVKGAQPWVGQAQWHYGSFYLWGDVPALMPITQHRKMTGRSLDRRRSGPGQIWGANHLPPEDGLKNTGGSWFNIGSPGQLVTNQNPVHDGIKQAGISGTRSNGKGDRWFQDGAAASGSKSKARKMASAQIAKIPFPLSQWIARVNRETIQESAA